MGDSERRSALPAILKAGGGCLGVILLVAGVTLYLNWERIQSAYRANAATLSELQSVRGAIQEAFDTPVVGVVVKRQISSNLNLPNAILSIELVNPPFLGDMEEAALEAKAREVAALAKRRHPSPEDFDVYEVVFTSRKGFVVTLGSRHHFAFRREDLDAP